MLYLYLLLHLENDHFKPYSLVCMKGARYNAGIFSTETAPEYKSGNVPSMASWPVWPLKLPKLCHGQMTTKS